MDRTAILTESSSLRKRKNQRAATPTDEQQTSLPFPGAKKFFKSASTSSLPSLTKTSSHVSINTGIDLDASFTEQRQDSTALHDFNDIDKSNNVVLTSQEAYTVYKTYISKSHDLPVFSNPPDSARITNLSEAMSTSIRKNIEHVCNDVEINSLPNHSLFTFHNDSHTSCPKTHISMKITPSILNKTAILNTIPSNHNMVYEMLLLDNGFIDYQPYLINFVTWAQSRNTVIIFTVPEQYEDKLLALLPNLNLIEKTRPFQQVGCTSLIT
jgi:hypothetical protein